MRTDRLRRIVDPELGEAIRDARGVELDIPLEEIPVARLKRDVIALVLEPIDFGAPVP